MSLRWVVNLCPFLHFENSGVKDYEHNVSIASWNLKSFLDFLDADESHRFCVGQVTLLEGFKRLFPNYWDKLHEAVLKGRVEIVGGAYVMPDFVIPDGESIVRQFQYGLRFIREELGVDVRTGWAIDSSGQCSQLPQILRQCGIDTLFFWRGMPHDAPTEFVWKGLDKSRVNAVWLAAGYDLAAWLSENIREAFSTLLDIIERLGPRAASHNLFVPVGGALVPPPPHLVDIVREWNRAFADMRAVVVTPREFADKVRSVQSKLSTIAGPLISGRFAPVRLGGLSSRVRLKILNRRLETLLYLVELYLALSQDRSRATELDSLWKILLFNQDHNIIRGVIADGPYQQALRRYEQAISQAEEILADAVPRAVSGLVEGDEGLSIVVTNPVGWSRDGIVRVEIDKSAMECDIFQIVDSRGVSVPYQIANSRDDGTVEVIFVASGVPSLGHEVFTVAPCEEGPEFETSIKTGPNWVENDRYVIEFDTFSGAVTRILDKCNQFEVLRGPGNYILLENDVGDLYRYDRSDLAPSHHDLTSLRTSGNIEIVESGPVRAVVKVTGKVGQCTRTQLVTVYHGIDRIDFETTIDFDGQDQRVSVEFPLTVFTDRVTVGAPFAAESRNTGGNDSDWSEPNGGVFPALDWVDCTGPEYGVTLIVFGLHEFSFRDGVLKMTLFRSVDHLSRGLDDEVVETDLSRERGSHRFTYSLRPHAGDWRESQTWRAATEHRLPLIAVLRTGHLRSGGEPLSMLTISGVDLVVSSIRPGNRDDEILLRLYEPAGEDGVTRLTFARPVDSAVLVDFRDHDIGELPVDDSTVTVPVDGYSIITLRVKLKSAPPATMRRGEMTFEAGTETHAEETAAKETAGDERTAEETEVAKETGSSEEDTGPTPEHTGTG